MCEGSKTQGGGCVGRVGVVRRSFPHVCIVLLQGRQRKDGGVRGWEREEGLQVCEGLLDKWWWWWERGKVELVSLVTTRAAASRGTVFLGLNVAPYSRSSRGITAISARSECWGVGGEEGEPRQLSTHE